MFAACRRLRVLSLVLALALPGLGGTVLQGFHPCEAALARVHGPAAGEHAHHHHEGSGGPGQVPAPCHCVGSCLHQVSLAPIVPTVLPVATSVPVVVQPGAPVPGFVVAHPFDHRPPSTAPPVG